MNMYELMLKTNDNLIEGGSLSDNQKNNIVKQLLCPDQGRASYPLLSWCKLS